MAEPNTIKVGDIVTHPDWPVGTVRRVTALSPLKRLGWRRGRYKMIDDYGRMICHLAEAVGGDDAWMEAGLEIAK
jgi:hypothetical protein